MPLIESRIELLTCKIIEGWARNEGITVLCFKLTAPGRRGVPDRVFLTERKVLFVEFKAPGKRPTKLQEYIHGLLRSINFEVQVHDDATLAVAAIKKALGTQAGADQGH